MWPFKSKETFVEDKPPQEEIGIVFESSILGLGDFYKYQNPDTLMGRKGHKVYRRMMLDDQVKAVMNFRRSAVLSRPYFFDVQEDNAEHQKQADFYEFALDAVEGSFNDAMWGMLSSEINGFSLSEINWKALEYEGPKWGIRTLKLRPFNTIEFKVDDHGNITEINQDVGNSVIVIPSDKAIYIVSQPDISPVYGESQLRACYREWWAKDTIIKLRNIWLERFASGFIYATVKAGLSAEQITKLKTLMNNIQARIAAIVPEGVELNHFQAENTDAYEKAIAQCDKGIAKSLLVPNLLGLSEQGQTGSYSQSRTQFDSFLWVIGQLTERLEEAINEQLIKQLALYNFGTDDFPRFKFRPHTDEQIAAIAEIWGNLIQKGAVTQSDTDENYLRELMGFPEKAEEEEPDEGLPDELPELPTEEEMPEPPDQEPFIKSLSEDFKAEAIKHFEEKPWLRRVDFAEIKTRFDTNENAFVDDANAVLGKIRVQITTQVRRLVPKDATFGAVKSKQVEQFTIPSGSIADLRKVFRGNLKKSFNEGLIQARQELPKRFASEERTGMDKLNAERYLDGRSFSYARDMDADLEKSVHNILYNSIKNDEKLSDVIIRLEEDETVRRLLPTVDKNGNPLNRPAQLERLARTATSDAFNQSRLSFFGDPDLKGFVQAFEYSALLDERTSDICTANDGKVRRDWGDRTPPNHFNCRSILVPVTVLDDWSGKQDNLTVAGTPAQGF